MEKAIYKINVKHDGKQELFPIHGYIFNFSGLRYGISRNYFFNGKEETGYTWTITELTTGYSVGCDGKGGKMQETINNFLHAYTYTGDFVTDLVQKAVENYTGGDANPDLFPKSDLLVAR